MERGDIVWAELPEAAGSQPGFRRPVLVIQDNAFNASKLKTVVVAVITSNLRLAAAPGNTFVTAQESGLPKDSVVNVSQLITVDKAFLAGKVGCLSGVTLRRIDEGLRLVLSI